ncbi:MAG: thioredoxin [Firmicutes bacterium]|nr:thioredoxin [Bacillota bacterium]
MINKVTNSDLTSAKAANFAVIDFSATWCGPCKMLAPIFEELSEEFADKVEFYGADVDENPNAAQEYRVASIPNIVFLKNGELVNQQIGFTPKEILKAMIEEYID